MKKNELKLELKKLTISKLGSLDKIKGGETVWCGTITVGGNASTGGKYYYDADTTKFWVPCDRES